MSRKQILGVSLDAGELPQPENRAPKNRSMPLLGVARKERDPATKLTANIGNALREQNDRLDRAEEIERRLAKGYSVIELDPTVIEPSFVRDRMSLEIDALTESIRDQGQQVPILVRPHPSKSGRYQVAFGHRRLSALAALGFPVKAVVRDLSDEELVVAQGQENNERADLTFIEKARFAHQLNQRFPREIIISALSIDKSNLSKLLILIDALPSDLIDAIGSAPGIGRPNWQQFLDLYEKENRPAEVLERAVSDDVQALLSADRFRTLLAWLKPEAATRAAPVAMTTPTGDRLAQVSDSKSKLEITIDKKAAPEFAAFVLEQLPKLFQEHRDRRQSEQGA